MLKTGRINFNDQITKTFINNVFNNEMHKIFIGFFYIPTIYTVFYVLFHEMNNQFEILRLKNVTMTTVIKLIKFYTRVNSITNDVINWEFTITSSFTKMVKKKKKGFSAIIKNMFSLWYCWPQNR